MAAERVEVVPDWLTYTSVAATVGAAVLALLAILYSGLQARKTQKAMLRERRADFELGLLAEMARQFGITQLQHLSGYVWALIRESSPPQDLPVLRAHFGRYPTQEGQEVRNAIPGDAEGNRQLHELVRVEIEAAIERRLA
jgi:hypothetical protein